MREKNPFKNIDWFLISLYLLLVGIGWVNIYAAVIDPDETISMFDFSLNSGRQFVWIIVACIFAFILLLFDVRIFSQFAYVFYGLGILSLLSVFVIGHEVGGAKAWIRFGSVNFQPAEFAKFTTAIALAKFIHPVRLKLSEWIPLGSALALILFPTAIIILQNETGSALVFISMCIMLYREGMPSWIMVAGITVVSLLVITLIYLEHIGIPLQTLTLLGIGISVLSLYEYAIRVKKEGPYNLKMLIIDITITLFFLFLAFMVYESKVTVLQSDDQSFINNPIFKKELITWVAFWAGSMILMLVIGRIYNSKYIFISWVSMICIIASISVAGLDFFIKDVLKDYQQKRLQVLVNPNIDPKGTGYQVNQSKIAIGSGGVWGKGFLQGTQTKLDFVPDQSTDFIFCTIGEEYGWMGSSALILLFITFLWRIMAVAERQKARFSRVYGYCVFGIFLFHFMINIGMTIGIFPVIGIPLPFISYGGSSLLSFTLLLFILIKLDMFRKHDFLVG